MADTSLRTIAANAGLTTGAMYRHFKDKDALFCALVDDMSLHVFATATINALQSVIRKTFTKKIVSLP